MTFFLSHLFIPRRSNNHKARLLHNQSLFLLIIFLLLATCFKITFGINGSVLGDAVSITTQQLLQLTNKERQQYGFPPLALNNELISAAEKKGENMFKENYWAHNAPDGTTPWVFIKNAGYDYSYAGENLARGFDSTESIMNAWMASPGHRENILSPNYKDVGFAILSGELTGEDTVLVVEEFGAPLAAASQNENTQPGISPQTVVNSPAQTGNKALQYPKSVKTANVNTAGGNRTFVFTIFTAKNVSVSIIAFLMGLLIIDVFYVERKRISRVSAHTADHIVFLGILLIIILILGKGSIL